MRPGPLSQKISGSAVIAVAKVLVGGDLGLVYAAYCVRS